MIDRAFRAVVVPILLACSACASVAETSDRPVVHLRASNASKAAIEIVAPLCATATGAVLRTDYANNPDIAKGIAAGTSFDAVVVESRMLEDLAGMGRVARGSLTRIAALDMGIATREPGPYPPITTEAEFRRLLSDARSIGYIGDGHSGALFLQVIDRLGMRAELGNRLAPFTGAYEGAVRESERLQYVVAPFFEPLPAPLRLVGKFPASLGADVQLSAGHSPGAGRPAAAFVRCLRSPASRKVFRAKGYRWLGAN